MVYLKVVFKICKMQNIIFYTHSHNPNTAMPASIQSVFKSIVLLKEIYIIRY